uniref:ZIP family metal transporter n=1 Tax=candidate division WOR-3 bacterium TaxID=2052148 RepID=A0A7V3ZXM2_UNCW3
MNNVLIGFLASLFAGLATTLGALFLIFKVDFGSKSMPLFLGLSGGIMFSASIFSLLIPALSKGALIPVLLVFLGGAFFVDFLDSVVPHEHFIKGLEGPSSRLKMVSLILLTMVIHNFPEGMAVGVSFAEGISPSAISLAIAIGLQNIPEGAAVALPLFSLGMSKGRAIFIAFLTGMIEPLAGLLGVSLGILFTKLLPYLMAFASGAMVYVVSDEMIPESHTHGSEKVATFSFMLGFVIMTLLDNLF